MRLLVILDGRIEKLENFVGTERDSGKGRQKLWLGRSGVVGTHLGQWDKAAERGRGCASGECLRLSLRGGTVMSDSLGSELMKELRRVEVEVNGVEGVKELGVRVF